MKEAGNYIEIDLSQEIIAPVEHKELSFDKKIEMLSEQYEEFLSMEQKGVIPEGENVDYSFIPKRKKELEEEYIYLVCEASSEEFQEWRFTTLERLMCGLMQEQNREESKGSLDRDHFQTRRLFSVFELYMVAKARRNEN